MLNEQWVYISFLGTSDYKSTTYVWHTQKARPTPYIQVAQLEILQEQNIVPDRIFVFGTDDAEEQNWNDREASELHRDNCYLCKTPNITIQTPKNTGLQKCLNELFQNKNAPSIEWVPINSDLNTSSQWKDFQTILEKIPAESKLIIDMTHGFRSVPILISSAIHFLKLTKKIDVQYVLYGVFNHEKKTSEIVNYVDFYEINDWTEAVSRLVDQADARMLSEVAQKESIIRLSTQIQDTKLPQALDDLTNSIRNVEANVISDKAQTALEIVKIIKTEANDVLTKMLMGMIEDKFAILAATPPLNGEYSENYFTVQIALAKLLIEHKLYMQAYTIMEESIASLGMAFYYKSSMYTSEKGEKNRRRASIFLNMVQFVDGMTFNKQDEKTTADNFMPFYNTLESHTRSDIKIDLLRSFVQNLQKLPENSQKMLQTKKEALSLLDELHIYTTAVKEARNGFNHAFTSNIVEANTSILKESAKIVEQLEAIFTYIFANMTVVTIYQNAQTNQHSQDPHYQEQKEAYKKELLDMAFDGQNLDAKAQLYSRYFIETEIKCIKERGMNAQKEYESLKEGMIAEQMQKTRQRRNCFKTTYPEYQEKLTILEDDIRKFKENVNHLQSALIQRNETNQNEQIKKYLSRFGTEEQLNIWKEEANVIQQEIAAIEHSENLTQTTCRSRFQKLIKNSNNSYRRGIEKEETRIISRILRRHENVNHLALLESNTKLRQIFELNSQPSWTLVIDETGDNFERTEEEELSKLGRFAGVLIPTNSTDVSKFIHCHEATYTDIFNSLKHIVEQETWSIVGLTMNDLPFVSGEQWIDGVSEIIAWVLRLIPLHETKTELIVKIEQRAEHKESSQLNRIQRLLLQDLARFSKTRANNIDLKVRFVNKRTNWVCYADVISYMWPKTYNDLGRWTQQSAIKTYLWENIHPVLRSCLDTYLSEERRELSGYQWRSLLLEQSELAKHITNVWIQKCREDEQQWRILLEDFKLHLDSKSINMRLVNQQSYFLHESNKEQKYDVPLIWSTLLNICRLAQENHQGKFISDNDLAQCTTNRQILLDENVRLVCFMDLHLAVSMTNSYQFDKARDMLQAWEGEECIRSIGYNYKGRVLSSFGQHTAFKGNFEQAEQNFEEALTMFSKLSDPSEIERECSQTRNYKIVNMLCQRKPLSEIWTEFEKQIPSVTPENRALFFAQTDDFAQQYNLYLYLRILYTHAKQDKACFAEVQCYLEHAHNWKMHESHPWPMISMYRALLYRSSGNEDLGKEHINLAIKKCRSNGVMEIFLATLKTIANLYFGGQRQINFTQLSQNIPHAKEHIDALQKVDKNQEPRDWLSQVLPFNFH